MANLDHHLAELAQVAIAVGSPMRTWRAQCVEELHGTVESWDVEARTQYEAGVQLRARLRAEGKVMHADLVWSAQ